MLKVFSLPLIRGVDKVIEETALMNTTSRKDPKVTRSASFSNSLPDEPVRPTPEIEKNHVHRVYDAIAPHFSSTRFAQWPKVSAFLNSLPPGSLVLDSGCGNGKYNALNPNLFLIGSDISPPLVTISAKKSHEVLVADAVSLPYRAGFADAAILVAVLHHLSTEGRRVAAIKEMVRAVRKGGRVLVTVWAVEQEDKTLAGKWTRLEEEWVETGGPRMRASSSCSNLESIPESSEGGDWEKGKGRGWREYFVPWHLPFHRVEVGSSMASGIGRKDERKGTVVYDRYYHFFAEGELESLVAGMDDAIIVDRFYDKSNWCIVLEKTF